MKKLILAIALGAVLIPSSFAFADIGPGPWEQTVAPYYESQEKELVTETFDDSKCNRTGTFDGGCGYPFTDTSWRLVDDTTLTEEQHMLTQFPRALYLTILIECIAAFVVLGALKLSKRIVLTVPLVSLVTLPLLWLALAPTIGTTYALFMLIVGEVTVVIAEAILLYALQRPRKLKFRHAFVISAVMNVVSVLVGFALNA